MPSSMALTDDRGHRWVRVPVIHTPFRRRHYRRRPQPPHYRPLCAPFSITAGGSGLGAISASPGVFSLPAGGWPGAIPALPGGYFRAHATGREEAQNGV